MSIVLVGLPGAGKSTVGRRLAARLGLPFADTDEAIAADADLSIPNIFARHGEAAFRDAERQLIAGLVERPPQVIATGGGAFLNPVTRARLLAYCTVIWLDGDVSVFARRAGPRPLLDSADPLGSLKRLAAVRNPIYAEAHLRIDSGALRPEGVVDRIVAALRI